MCFLDNKICNEYATIYTPRVWRPAEGEENTMFTLQKLLIILIYFVFNLICWSCFKKNKYNLIQYLLHKQCALFDKKKNTKIARLKRMSKSYTLHFVLHTVAFWERTGFGLDDVTTKFYVIVWRRLRAMLPRVIIIFRVGDVCGPWVWKKQQHLKLVEK